MRPGEDVRQVLGGMRGRREQIIERSYCWPNLRLCRLNSLHQCVVFEEASFPLPDLAHTSDFKPSHRIDSGTDVLPFRRRGDLGKGRTFAVPFFDREWLGRPLQERHRTAHSCAFSPQCGLNDPGTCPSSSLGSLMLRLERGQIGGNRRNGGANGCGHQCDQPRGHDSRLPRWEDVQ